MCPTEGTQATEAEQKMAFLNKCATRTAGPKMTHLFSAVSAVSFPLTLPHLCPRLAATESAHNFQRRLNNNNLCCFSLWAHGGKKEKKGYWWWNYPYLVMNSHFPLECDSRGRCQLATQRGFHLQQKHRDVLDCMLWLLASPQISQGRKE